MLATCVHIPIFQSKSNALSRSDSTYIMCAPFRHAGRNDRSGAITIPIIFYHLFRMRQAPTILCRTFKTTCRIFASFASSNDPILSSGHEYYEYYPPWDL